MKKFQVVFTVLIAITGGIVGMFVYTVFWPNVVTVPNQQLSSMLVTTQVRPTFTYAAEFR